MQFAEINKRKRAQRARRDAEREMAPRHGPPALTHGDVIGRIVIEYRGQRVEATLLQAGERCRTIGVRIGDEPVAAMGLYAACARVSAKLGRMPSARSDFWRD